VAAYKPDLPLPARLHIGIRRARSRLRLLFAGKGGISLPTQFEPLGRADGGTINMDDIALREKLADAGRILEIEGQGDYCMGHVTVRQPENPGRILMKAGGMGLEEMTPDNIVTIDIEGEKVAGTHARHNEVYIHTEIMRVRPEIQSVVHTHAPHSVIFSSLGKPLQPVGHPGAAFSDGLPVFSETTDLIVTQELGKAVARCLGQHQVLLLRNHGIVTAGRTLEEAIYLALVLEKACWMQLVAESAGGAKLVTSPEEAKAKKRITRAENQINLFNYMVRRVARLR
jgi:L-ribulose-5-phosphate 4-epimerase